MSVCWPIPVYANIVFKIILKIGAEYKNYF